MSASAQCARRRTSRGRQMLVHQLERGIAGLALRAIWCRCARSAASSDAVDPEAQRRDVGLVVILLPEHPAQHVGPVEPVGGDQLASRRPDRSRRRCFRGGSDRRSWSTGMRPLALTSARNSGVRVSPFMMSYRAARAAGRDARRSAGSCSNSPTRALRGGSASVIAAPSARSCRHARPLPSAHGRRPPRRAGKRCRSPASTARPRHRARRSGQSRRRPSS